MIGIKVSGWNRPKTDEWRLSKLLETLRNDRIISIISMHDINLV